MSSLNTPQRSPYGDNPSKREKLSFFTKPQFNSKYTDDNKELYLGNEDRQHSPSEDYPRKDSKGSISSTSPSTSRNASHFKQHGVELDTIEAKLSPSQQPRKDSVGSLLSNTSTADEERNSSHSTNMSRSYTSFLSLKHDRSSQSSKKSSKRSSLLNRLLPSRKDSDISDRSSKDRNTSVSSKKSDGFHPLAFTHHPQDITKDQVKGNSSKISEEPVQDRRKSSLSSNKHGIQSHFQSHIHSLPLHHSQTVHSTRIPSEANQSRLPTIQPYRASISGQSMHRPSTDIQLNDPIFSVPMSASNTIAQSYGISLIDENDSEENVPLSMSRINSVASIIPSDSKAEKTFWQPPESWKVRGEAAPGAEKNDKPPAIAMESPESDLSLPSNEESTGSPASVPTSDNKNIFEKRSKSAGSSSLSTNDNTTRKQKKSSGSSSVKNSSNELKGSSRSSVRVFKGEKSSLLPCTLETTCKNILDVLSRKRFLKQDDDHMLVLKCGGLTRTLSLEEKPLKIQRSMLFLYGYTERDNLDFIERTDLSFLFKFIVEEKGVELISEEKKRMINPQNVNLDNWNLQDIPNFLYAEPVVTLDVSHNPSFEFTKEFMHDSRNLTSLSFTRSGSPVFPSAIVYTPRLTNLDLEVNYIKHIPSEISMLSTLTTLNIACNRISYLPPSFSMLYNLQSLNLSSNRLKKIPPEILKLENLRKLDLSYNSITTIPEELASLTGLEVLQIAGNGFHGELPEFFCQFSHLIKVDIRFNKFTSIDSLKSSKKLEIIRATGNNISVFRCKAVNLFEVELNMNPLTYVYFECEMPNLKVVDFSKGKLSSCTFTSRLVGAEKLLLDHNHLSILPDYIHNMKNLSHFSIFKNNLTNLPKSIGKLTKLKYLDLHLNNIGKLTKNIWYLESLETLNLASNLLETFPDPPDNLFNSYNTPTQLEKLRSVHSGESYNFYKSPSDQVTETEHAVVDENNDSTSVYEVGDDLTDLPKDIGNTVVARRSSETGSNSINLVDKNLTGLAGSLKNLCLCDNKLTDTCFPTLALFYNLVCLNLSYNEIFEIPTGYIPHFSGLESLYLSGNYLSSLPIEDLDCLENVKTLHLNGNRFGTLPAELSKLSELSALDVGSNQLKYNIGNIPYDWNWCYNKNLKYLNFSGNKRLEIKPQHNTYEGEKLDSFLGLKHLKMLGLMDVTITTDAVPDQSVERRIRSTVSQLGSFGYGISDSLGEYDSLTTRDVVIEKFRGNSSEFLITIYDGKNTPQKGGDKISKIIQETFEIHLIEELKTLGENVVNSEKPKTVEDCLRGAFLTMNSEMSILINKDESSTFSSAAAHRTKTTDKLTLEEDGLSGCSATIIYIRDDYIYVANVGDIMGILTKSDGEFNIITTKHEPYAPKEYNRLRDSGGYVTTDGYLDGVSEVSRAVGFFKLIPHINAKPSIHKFKLTQNEEMIAICTNEIWKRVPYELAADIIRQEKSNPIGAAEKLRDFAISYGSKNRKVTAVVLSLRQFTTKQKHHGGSRPEDSTLRKLDEEIEPPTGELAMVFTDIKNSTLLWDNYPAAMRSAIKVHNSIMRRQLRIIGGYEVKTEGDAFIVSFPTPTAALLWCFIVQQQLLTTSEWPAEILSSDQGFEVKDSEGNLIFRGLSVRMGIHWGAPVCEMDIVTKRMDYFGPMVNRASRVSSVADGGQITMSTDFFHEIEKVRKVHEMVANSKIDVNRAYGYKVKSKDVENQMNQLDKIGYIQHHIGAKKLKGLETPENIWITFPKLLESRAKLLNNDDGQIVNNKQTKLVIGGITSESVWKIRAIALRLEKVNSYLNSRYTGVPAHFQNLDKTVKSQAEDVLSSKLATVDAFMLMLLDHTITRIENCVTILGTRQVLGKHTPHERSTLMMIDEIRELKDELTLLQSKLAELEKPKKESGVDYNNDSDKIVEL